MLLVQLLVPHINWVGNLSPILVLKSFQFENRFQKSDPISIWFLLTRTNESNPSNSVPHPAPQHLKVVHIVEVATYLFSYFTLLTYLLDEVSKNIWAWLRANKWLPCQQTFSKPQLDATPCLTWYISLLRSLGILGNRDVWLATIHKAWERRWISLCSLLCILNLS